MRIALAKIIFTTELKGRGIDYLSVSSETELLHRPRDSGGSSTDRHYSTIHSVTQSYVTKAFHLQAHCGNPAILIAAARYPLQPFTLWGVLDRPCTPTFSTATHRLPPSTLESLFYVPELRIFPVLRILLSYGSVLCWQQSTPRFHPHTPYANSSYRRLLPNILALGERYPIRASKMFTGTRDVF